LPSDEGIGRNQTRMVGRESIELVFAAIDGNSPQKKLSGGEGVILVWFVEIS
jgi:hypothetical protein